MSRDDDLEDRLDRWAEQEPGLRPRIRLDPRGAVRVHLAEQEVLAEREQVLADEELQLELDAERDKEASRENEATEIELGLRSIWDVPR